MFSLREFIKRGLINAIGKMPDYYVIMNATGWYEKGVLTENDLAEINEKLTPVEEENAENVVEQGVEETPEEE